MSDQPPELPPTGETPAETQWTTPAASELPPAQPQPPPGAADGWAPPPGGYRPPPGSAPPHYAPPPAAPARRGGGATCLIITLIVVGIVVLGSVFVGMAVMGSGSAARFTVPGSTGDTVGIINISGLITCGGGMISPFGGMTAGSESITGLLREASKEKAVKALVIRIDSPGGSAAAAQEIYQAIQEFQKDPKDPKAARRPVIASMADVAASGGYYVAAPCDKIVALPSTMTGSIGVILETMEYHELMKRFGVRGNAITSGPHKDMGSPFRAMTAEEQRIFRAMIDDVYDQFVTAVAEGRKMDKAKVRKLADGRVYTGRQAKKVGLVDELGSFRDAIRLAAKQAGIKGEPTLRTFGHMTLFDTLFGPMQSRAQQRTVVPPGLLFDSRLWPLADMMTAQGAMPRVE
jgi:protease-4